MLSTGLSLGLDKSKFNNNNIIIIIILVTIISYGAAAQSDR